MIRGFLAPGRLGLLAVVVALAVGYVLLQRRRSAYAVRFAQLPLLASVAPRRPGWRRHLPAALLLLALTALVTAFARPEADVRVPRERATIIVAIDTSLSMEATDVQPNRLAAAKSSAAAFVAGLPSTFTVGLVGFNGVASLVVPPTQDRTSVAGAVQQLRLGPSTAIGEAVFTGLAAIRAQQSTDGGNVPARIVLLTDGTNTVGRDVGSAAAAARQMNVPVSTISFGTPNGVVQVQGQNVPVPVDVPSMQTLAQATGGTSFTAQSGDELRRVYADIGNQVGFTVKRREVTDVVTGVGLVLALVAAAGSLVWTSRLP